MLTQFKPVLLIAGLLWAGPADPTAGQETVSQLNDSLRQPGDDIARPAEPDRPIDPNRAEALAWYMKGIEAQKNNDLDAALKAFEKASAADETAPDPIRARAVLLLQLGDIQKGLSLARKAISLDETDFRTRFQLATSLLRLRSNVRTIREAIELLDEAAASERLTPVDPEFILIHSVRGRILLQLKQNAKAAESYQVLLQALERPEDFGLDFRRHKALMDDRMTGYETVGEALLSVGRTDEALRAFEALVRIRQDSPGRHHLLLAQARFRADDIEEAEASLENYFSTHRREKNSLELLTQLYSATARSSQLIAKLTELQSDTPDETVVKLYLAETQLRQGHFDDATKTFESVILESGDPAGYPGLIRIDIVRADANSLIKTLQKALRARVQLAEIVPFLPEILTDHEFAKSVVGSCLDSVESNENLFPEVCWVCAQIAQEIEASEEQRKLLQATLDRNPSQDIGQRTLQQLGMHHLLNDRFADSVTVFRRLLAIRTLPVETRVLTLRNLAIAEVYNERIGQALEAIQSALAIYPQNPELLYRLGWIYFQDSKSGDAQESLEAAIEKGKDAPDVQNSARMLLATIHSQAGRWDECINVYQNVIDSPAQDEVTRRRARLSLSAVYVERGDNSSAEMILEELFEEQPDDPGVNNDLGYLYADQNKNLEQAFKMIELAVEAEPDNRAYLDSLGWVLYRLERYEEALEALLTANSDPEFQDATLQEHLGDVYKALGRDDEAVELWKKALSTEQSSDVPDDAVIKRLNSRLPGTDVASKSKPPEGEPVTSE
ncbi:MAG: tetratricopeptide repeat protein [Fuerstiella sp.]|nr:tetratricopeptide repeat protein [Fuerstiella sp.]